MLSDMGHWCVQLTELYYQVTICISDTFQYRYPTGTNTIV